jgi:hypothetical protein
MNLKVFPFYTNYNFSNLFNYSLNFPLQENTDLEKFVEEKLKHLGQPFIICLSTLENHKHFFLA